MKFAVSAAALALAAGIAAADINDLRVTEAWTGLSGPDGTADWIELTNTGATAVNLGGLYYDDASADITAGGALPAINLRAGGSVVILVDLDPVDRAAGVAEFKALWGDVRAFATQGGGLSNSDGDSIYILDSNGDTVTLADSPAAFVGQLATIDYIGGTGLSQLGVNGAYESAPFANDNFGTAPDFLVTLVGSPTPAPGAAGLLGVAGLVAVRRRR